MVFSGKLHPSQYLQACPVIGPDLVHRVLDCAPLPVWFRPWHIRGPCSTAVRDKVGGKGVELPTQGTEGGGMVNLGGEWLATDEPFLDRK